MTDDDRIRGLEETIAAQGQRLGELAKLRDIAHDAKARLIGEHATERTKRQTLEIKLGQAVSLISELVGTITGAAIHGGLNIAHAAALTERVEAWLKKLEGPAS